jgi:cob(I)alamin adenosyltransferase
MPLLRLGRGLHLGDAGPGAGRGGGAERLGIAKEQILDPSIRFVLLDEINIALRYDYLDIDEVVDFLLTRKPPMTHVCLTGRNAKPELIEAADLVTEMTLVKHPFRDGVKAQNGVEF